LESWIEFQNYHIEPHEGYEKDLQGKTEELDSARKKLETSFLEDPEVVGFLESGVKNRESKLEEHDKMLRWIEQQRKAMVTEQATSLQASRDHDRPRILSTPRRKTDKNGRSPLGTAVSKQPPLKRRSSRLQKSNTAQVANNATADSNEARGSTRLAGVGDVVTHPATIFVDQPIDLFYNRPAHTAFLHVCIRARPVALLVSSLFNGLQGKITSCRPCREFRIDIYITMTIPAQTRCPRHPDNIFNTTNSLTIKFSFDLTKSLLFSSINSILVFIPRALSNNHVSLFLDL
jgi:hypothetical protein